MSLSDKRIMYGNDLEIVYKKNDVREAVKELKKEIKKWSYKDDEENYITSSGGTFTSIDEIFGEELSAKADRGEKLT